MSSFMIRSASEGDFYGPLQKIDPPSPRRAPSPMPGESGTPMVNMGASAVRTSPQRHIRPASPVAWSITAFSYLSDK